MGIPGKMKPRLGIKGIFRLWKEWNAKDARVSTAQSANPIFHHNTVAPISTQRTGKLNNFTTSTLRKKEDKRNAETAPMALHLDRLIVFSNNSYHFQRESTILSTFDLMWIGKSTVWRCCFEETLDCNITECMVAPIFFSRSFISFNYRCREFIFFSITHAGLNLWATVDSIYYRGCFLPSGFFVFFIESSKQM